MNCLICQRKLKIEDLQAELKVETNLREGCCPSPSTEAKSSSQFRLGPIPRDLKSLKLNQLSDPQWNFSGEQVGAEFKGLFLLVEIGEELKLLRRFVGNRFP